MDERYPFREVEARWQARWAEELTYATPTPDAGARIPHARGGEPWYQLEMFPYPSGELHWGHVRNYAIGDAAARYRTMHGHAVLHPMGFDSFGLPAENAAIARSVHPGAWTEQNMDRTRRQFQRMAFSYDWSRELATSRPDFYRWTQWLFLQFFRAGLAYKRNAPVNWCPSCATALANEQVIQGACERCGSHVTKKSMTQWFWAITKYADRLLANLDGLDWPDDIKTMQRNWIGRSEGAFADFHVQDTDWEIKVFTTRPDTLFGVTYLVLAPEHPLVEALTRGTEREAEVAAFVERMRRQTEIERTAADAPKEGVPLGAFALNPANGEPVPIWTANYVLYEYATGAVMGVPAHDTRDFQFATEQGLPIRAVIRAPDASGDAPLQAAYIDAGVQINSGRFDGLPSEQAKPQIAAWLEEIGQGGPTINFRLRDWLISRQRYWGAPIPIVYCEQCGTQPVPEEQLPVLLPADVQFTGKGESPLTTSAAFVHAPCPKCGGPATRDVDTMDTFVDSSWYFLRFASPNDPTQAWDPEAVGTWLPVDHYIGGREHATMHLIYARFVTMALHDLGLLPFEEPFTRLFNQGILYYGGKKLSKRHNVISPDALCDKYGVDASRLYVLFLAPPNEQAEWNENGVEGVSRFLSRAWRFAMGLHPHFVRDWRAKVGALTGDADRALRRKTHQTIERVTEDMERLHYNTSVSALMELVNALHEARDAHPAAQSEALETLLRLLQPLAPYATAELWERFVLPGTAYHAAWPDADPEVTRVDEVEVIVQVNGKLRDRLRVAAETPPADLERLALASERVQALMDGRSPKKVIVVPCKLVNVVI